ncbi:Nucleotide-binding oligomerization domain-containing protein 2 [Holothuria leucospilota]|uniref:Nucleotide-binding oligomerization domain-containing protein 2 n=1 Tax=Holothuria leucospilota TaxID=206669 RepID=A0A9Q1CTT1_HOLLE|nr:Nucleotide-binding oligomerization domain-containing protein 2 [Holothuria leucospilota]
MDAFTSTSKTASNEGFGRFVVEVASLLTLVTVKKLAVLLNFSPAEIDIIERDPIPGYQFLSALREKGFICEESISPLIDSLNSSDLHGIAENVMKSFRRNITRSHPQRDLTSDIQGKKEHFLKEIRETYEDICNGVQPVPYLRQRLMCVDNVFTDSGLEYFHKQGGTTGEGMWGKLDSYNSIFIDPRFLQAMVFLILGEPGYGKSTLALQYAYDWCKRSLSSPLKEVEILIFLRLRYLKGLASIFSAIKQFLLPCDSRLSESDIEDIILNCNSKVIVLDGFDEYLSSDNANSDVTKIISRQMFRDFRVILTTRPSSIPTRLSYKTEKLRLIGFDKQSRERYILKAVVDCNSEAAAKIVQRLQQNPVLADICQVPLFFVMFAHLTYEKETSFDSVLDSVTSFFRYVVSCFYEHIQIKTGSYNTATATSRCATTHHQLNKLAFESLQGKNQRLVWRKDTLIEKIGKIKYNELVEIGILVEENVMTIVDDPGTSAADHIQRRTDVTFYHKLFCEWYAAHYVADYVTGPYASNLQKFFELLSPFSLQYVYRIACGLNPAAAEKIIHYLHSIEGGDKFAILCILEQTGKVDKIKDIIRRMCSQGIIISGHESLLLQRSTMQLLEIAGRNEIPIEYLILSNCLQSVDLATGSIRITSGLALSSKTPVSLLQISMTNREITEDEAIAILEFSSMCPSIRGLRYWGCVPPVSFRCGSTLSTLKSRGATVWWRWDEYSPRYYLNLQSGRWENICDQSEPTANDFEQMPRGSRQES